jgi:UDP-N-acetylmuramyl tripeptide synthase
LEANGTWPTPVGDHLFRLPLAGLYNACNALGAAAAASCLGVDPDLVQAAAKGTVGAFGGLEQVRIGDRQVLPVLVKNPSRMPAWALATAHLQSQREQGQPGQLGADHERIAGDQVFYGPAFSESGEPVKPDKGED